MNPATQFLQESYSELRQASWLTREQAVDSAKAVLLLVAMLSAYVAAIDYVLSILVRAFLGR